MITLGISAIDKESTICLLDDQEILYAVSEERLSRVKQQDGFPFAAIEEGLDVTGLSLKDIDAVCHSFMTTEQELKMRREAVRGNVRYVLGQNGYPLGRRLFHLFNAERVLPFSAIPKYNAKLEVGLNKLGIDDKLHRYHHQLCHAASAYYTTDVDRALVLTLDGYGSGFAGGAFLGGKRQVEARRENPLPAHDGGLLRRHYPPSGLRPSSPRRQGSRLSGLWRQEQTVRSRQSPFRYVEPRLFPIHRP